MNCTESGHICGLNRRLLSPSDPFFALLPCDQVNPLTKRGGPSAPSAARKNPKFSSIPTSQLDLWGPEGQQILTDQHQPGKPNNIATVFLDSAARRGGSTKAAAPPPAAAVAGAPRPRSSGGGAAAPVVARRIKAVEVDLAGCSYNPDPEAHQDALAVLVGAEMKRVLKRELAPLPPPRVVDVTDGGGDFDELAELQVRA